MKKKKSQGKAVGMTVNSKEENFCLDFVQEFGLRNGFKLVCIVNIVN